MSSKTGFKVFSQMPVDICDEEICENNLEPQDEITVMCRWHLSGNGKCGIISSNNAVITMLIIINRYRHCNMAHFAWD